MVDEKNSQKKSEEDNNEKKESPLAHIKPKEIPTIRHTFEYHRDSKIKKSKDE